LGKTASKAVARVVSSKLCKVSSPGFFTTVQDPGRSGFQRFGVPVSGAMDDYAFTAANLLVGNNPADACLEVTMHGPDLLFLREAQIAIAGATFSPSINGERVECWTVLQVRRGDRFFFGSALEGCRGYLAVRGGIDVPVVLGSRSTYVRGSFGGFQGRQLKAGDVLEFQQPFAPLASSFSMPQELIPEYSREVAVKVVLGPQTECFTERGLETFLSSTYEVTIEADRMGYRLEGAEVKLKDGVDMVTDAMIAGAVQVPRDGKPMVLMRDAQTTGGYPKIAVVTTPDVSRLGQAKPKDQISFFKISPSQARERLVEYRKLLRRLKGRLNESRVQS
jgi:antagonist of KipI